MSHYSRPPRQAAFTGDTPAFLYGRHRRRGGAVVDGVRGGEVRLEYVAHPEALLAAYDTLAARGGAAPGRDGVTYADLGRGEVCAALRDLSKIVLRGDYRPAPSRTISFPKASGNGRRRLSLRGLLDRVVSAALNRALTPVWEPSFFANSHGFRPRRGVWTLLAALEAAVNQTGRTVLAQDDVRNAFPSVVIDHLLQDHRERIADPGLLTLIEAVVRGGDEPGRALGIAQGDPASPLFLNVRFHATHDAPLTRDAADCAWYRYADNVVYLTGSMTEGQDLLGRIRELLTPAGFALKGADGPPTDLREEETQLLGFRLSLTGDRLRVRPGNGAWNELTRHLGDAWQDDDPHGAARRAVLGWVSSYGPAFETSTESETLDRIYAAAASQGFRELTSPETLRARMRDAHRRWQDLRRRERERGEGRRGDHVPVGRSAPTIAPGVRY